MGGIFSLAVLISGRGSNLKSLIENAQNYSVTHVFSDNPEAPGNQIARDHGVELHTFKASDFDSKERFLTDFFAKVESSNSDLICLAGFMRIVPKEFIKRNGGKIINIHPSLLPDLPGLKTHERALQEKRIEHGCTVHYVDSGIDTGPRIAQAKVAVLPDDTFETLASRVIQREHEIYPWVVSGIASGEITHKNREVNYSEKFIKEALMKNFILPGIPS